MAAAAALERKSDVAGWVGAVLGHAALFAAFVLLLPDDKEEEKDPPAMEVSFVEEVGPVSTAPQAMEEPAPSIGEDMGAPDQAAGADAAMPEPQPVVAPMPEPIRPPVETGERRRPDLTRNAVPVQPRPQPQPQQRPQNRVVQNQPRPQTQRPQPQPQRQTQARPQPQRGPSFADVMRSFGGNSAAPRNSNTRGTAQQPRAAVASPQARASFTAALARQIERCSRRQRPPALEARELRPVVRFSLNRDGSLSGAPTVVRVEGATGVAAQYQQQARDAIVRAITSCQPYTGLPAELYDVPNGWKQPPQIRLNFQ